MNPPRPSFASQALAAVIGACLACLIVGATIAALRALL